MGKLRRLVKETAHLQKTLAAKNKRIGELETENKRLKTPTPEKKP